MAGQKGGKKGRKLGRDEAKCKSYRARHTRDINKAVRIARSSGYDHACEYAGDRGCLGEVRKRIAHFKFRNPAYR